MTFEEQEEFKVLKEIYGKAGRILLDELETIINEEFSDGLYVTLNAMAKKGLLERGIYSVGNFADGVKSEGYMITRLGERKFHYLKQKKIKKIYFTILYWGTFVAALISAFGVLKSCKL